MIVFDNTLNFLFHETAINKQQTSAEKEMYTDRNYKILTFISKTPIRNNIKAKNGKISWEILLRLFFENNSVIRFTFKTISMKGRMSVELPISNKTILIVQK